LAGNLIRKLILMRAVISG